MELVGLKPDLILSQNTPTTAATLQQTRTIAIIPLDSNSVRRFNRGEQLACSGADFENALARRYEKTHEIGDAFLVGTGAALPHAPLRRNAVEKIAPSRVRG